MRVWNRATGEPWAITTTALNNILEIAARNNETPEAVAAKLGKKLQNSHDTTIRDNVAVIPVIGPLFRYANLFTQVSGASSYEILAKDFTTALENAEVKAIVFNIDSPGGEVGGCAELAYMIYNARGKKPIIAYASGDVCSGAYWIASATDQIVISPTSSIGSIGVVGVYRHDKEPNNIEIVSSQSPYKRLDPSTDIGRERLQRRIDELAGVFIRSVAQYRNVSDEHVQKKYGSGDVFVGDIAVQQGLAEKASTFEQLLSELQHKQQQTQLFNPEYLSAKPTEVAMDESTLINKDRQSERKRIKAILTDDEAKLRTELAYYLAFDTDLTIEKATTMLSKAPYDQHKRDNSGFAAAMATVGNPEITPSNGDDESDEVIAKRIATY